MSADRKDLTKDDSQAVQRHTDTRHRKTGSGSQELRNRLIEDFEVAVSLAIAENNDELVRRLATRRHVLFQQGMDWLQFALLWGRVFTPEEEREINAFRQKLATSKRAHLRRPILRKLKAFKKSVHEFEKQSVEPHWRTFQRYARAVGVLIEYTLVDITPEAIAERVATD